MTEATGAAGSAERSGVAADHNRSRTAAERVECSLAAITPSIMSATTATAGRPRSCTDTVADPSDLRRIDLVTPATRGGLRNAGERRPCRLASMLNCRATWANRTEVNSAVQSKGCSCRVSTASTMAAPCDSKRSRPAKAPLLEADMRGMRRVWTTAGRGRQPRHATSITTTGAATSIVRTRALVLALCIALLASACSGSTPTTDRAEATAASLPLSDTGNENSNGDITDGRNPDGDDSDAERPDNGATDQTDRSPTDTTSTDSEAVAGCLATSAADGVNVSWWGMSSVVDDNEPDGTDGMELDILGDGRVLVQAGSQDEGVITLFGAPPEPGMAITLKFRSADHVTTFECGTAGTLTSLPVPDCSINLIGGKPQLVISYEDDSAGPLGRTVIRDGERLETNPSGGPNPIDTSAEPGVTYRYQIEMSDSSERDPVIADCGSVTAPELGDRSAELLAAKDLFGRTALGPHAYFTMSSDGANQDFYMQALGPDGHAFVPPLDDQELRNPFTIHDELVAAIERGQDVTYALDASSGLPMWWLVDGATTTLLCFEVDTAPPELRVGACDPETDFIGR